MGKKIRNLAWFAKHPQFWEHAAHLVARKFTRKVGVNEDSPELRFEARRWAAERAVSVHEALQAVGLCALTEEADALPRLHQDLLEEAEERSRLAEKAMGGAGNLDLIYAATRLSGATRVIETGVAYGWSSLAILAGFNNPAMSRLISIDMPYPGLNNEKFVGIVVPENLKLNWELIREPDRRGIEKAITKMGGRLDLCHYDSDKTYPGRQYGYSLLWDALKTSGIFLSDDIQDNIAFQELVEAKQVPYAVIEYDDKYVGIAKKI